MDGKARILIADDDESVRIFLAEGLERHGYRVLTARDGRDGLDMLARNPDVAVVVTDWMMPRLNGLDFTREIRTMTDAPPVIMMTARNRREDVLSALAAGVHDYVAKPVHLGQLVIRLQALMDRLQETVKKRMQRDGCTSIDAGITLTIVDISASGCRLEASFPLQSDAVLFIESPLLAERLGLDAEYSFPARVINCAPAGRRFHAWATFVGLERSVADRLQAACASPTGFRYQP